MYNMFEFKKEGRNYMEQSKPIFKDIFSSNNNENLNASDQDFLDQLKEIDEIQQERATISVKEVEEKRIERAEKIYRLRHQQQIRTKIREREVKRFTKSILLSMENLTDEEKIKTASKLLHGENGAIGKMASVYMKNVNTDEIEISDVLTIVKESLNRVIEESASRIEQSHKEFPQVVLIKNHYSNKS